MRHRHLAALTVLPFLLSGCGLTGGSGTGGAGATPAPSSTPWIVGAQGSPAASPTVSRPSASVGAGDVFAFLPLPARTGTPRVNPRATCAPATYDFSRIGALSVTPGTTSATVGWYNVGGYNLVQFRVTAISQDVHLGKQRDIGFVTITPANPCGPITGTVAGLDRKTHYIFSVDAVVTRRSGDGTHAATVYRSGPVLTR